jgi:hypothetical protein
MNSTGMTETNLKAYREAVANLAYDAHCLDYYVRVSERFGKPERFYSED